MDPKRWKQLDAILQSTLDRPTEEREAFLRSACAGDDALESEVLSLLKADRDAAEFLEHQAIEVAARVVGLNQTNQANEPIDSPRRPHDFPLPRCGKNRWRGHGSGV